ncbi:MAG: cupin domain-containing protein [Anaerolineaceae bacterium]|nr:cupin domain-containing protein [Anaerolineaceae bacterium]
MSVIHKFSVNQDQFQWEDVESIPYDVDGIKSASKHILIGEKEGAPNSIMRYFSIAPGGHSRLERHPHEHEVLIIQGKGKVQIGENYFNVNPFDAVFVEGNELHQFSNPYDKPFGFICVIPKKS